MKTELSQRTSDLVAALDSVIEATHERARVETMTAKEAFEAGVLAGRLTSCRTRVIAYDELVRLLRFILPLIEAVATDEVIRAVRAATKE